MGIFSDINRFHEAGDSPNANNVARFGEPARSLFTTSKLVTLHKDISVMDNAENIIYRAESKFPSIHDKTYLYDADGKQVAYIWRKFFTLRHRHYVEMADGTTFEIANELLHVIKDIINIEGLGWQIRGNILGLNFELYDQNDEIIAVIAQKLLSIHDKYCIDIYKPQYEKTVVAILITLQHIMQDRESERAASESSSSSDNG
ncbi:MAG: LURP-one-related family protein [Lachnospiraceae bacterium]|nr:LURP-one-related family protein [Lachnospiraceae bacterium]